MGSLPVGDSMFSVNFKIDAGLAKRLESLFPAYKFVASTWSSTESMHPILHCERLVKEAEALKLTRGKVVDIGGNPQRHRKLDRLVWSMCPVLSAADVHRRDKLEQSGAMLYCDHKVPDFDEECACTRADTYLSVDSLYYLTPSDINAVVRKAALIAVIHDFSQPQGSFYGESKYTLRPDGTVLMTVNGSSIAYEHSALGWMRVGCIS